MTNTNFLFFFFSPFYEIQSIQSIKSFSCERTAAQRHKQRCISVESQLQLTLRGKNSSFPLSGRRHNAPMFVQKCDALQKCRAGEYTPWFDVPQRWQSCESWNTIRFSYVGGKDKKKKERETSVRWSAAVPQLLCMCVCVRARMYAWHFPQQCSFLLNPHTGSPQERGGGRTTAGQSVVVVEVKVYSTSELHEEERQSWCCHVTWTQGHFDIPDTFNHFQTLVLLELLTRSQRAKPVWLVMFDMRLITVSAWAFFCCSFF